MANTVSYTPTPHEQPYYEGLFQAADIQRAGNIGGAEAVAFFTRSKLQVETLKNIWTLADQNPTTNSLDRKKFAVAIRLIQLAQNGQKAQGASLGAPPGVVLRPAMFEGVSGVTLALPPPEGAAPQQQQQPPRAPPSPVQQQPQAPPTPPRHPVAAGAAPPAMSMALTAQDPYTLTPQEQNRYESLFPQYEKSDGYVYGKEAVELFSKSGVPQEQLREIWNMVDTPVDNRLDKLEFCMAMHLIVCLSKKNLPMPPGLPISLKTLKSQSEEAQMAPQMAQQSQMAQQQQMAGPPPVERVGTMDSGVSGGPPSLGGGQAVGSPPSLGQAPPIVAAGGMNISDAFEGLDGSTGAAASVGSSDAYGMGGGGYGMAAAAGGMAAAGMSMGSSIPQVASVDEDDALPAPATMAARATSPVVAAPVPVAPPKTTKQLAESYNMENEHAELMKLKETLQKLQAENISLKSQLGTMTEDEKDVQKEVAATVHEIGELSNELTTLRAQVLASKSKLLESTAELKAAKEKKGVLTDLITETSATREALDSANADIHTEVEAQAAAAIPAPTPNYEADLFGSHVPAPAPAIPASQSRDEAEHFAPEPLVSEKDAGLIPTPVAANGDQATFGGIPEPAAPAPAPAMGEPLSAEQPYQQQPQQQIPSGMFGTMKIEESSSFEKDGLMGGVGSLDGSSFAGGYDSVGATPSNMSAGAFSHNPPAAASALTAVDVENMKAASVTAEKKVEEADETFRTLAAEADKLRTAADQSEALAREKQEAAAGKNKKRGLGRGKKKLMHEAEQAANDAAEKKKHFLEMQNQANNARSLAMESKREAEKLRHAAEQAELDLVKSQSAAEAHATDMAHTQAAMATQQKPETNGAPGGYPSSAAPAFGGTPAAPAFGGAPTAPPANMGYGGGPSNVEGFGMGGAMGGGSGDGIPTPPQSAMGGDDPYSNPF